MTRFILIVAILVCALCGFVARAYSQVNVTQKNNNLSRDGLYIDPAFTPVNAANLVRDLNFDGTIVGNVHAQPLYIEGGPNGPMIIAVTASNNIYALHASTGAVIWQRTDIGPAVTSGLPCGKHRPQLPRQLRVRQRQLDRRPLREPGQLRCQGRAQCNRFLFASRRHPERSTAKFKDPVSLPQCAATGFLDFARNDNAINATNEFENSCAPLILRGDVRTLIALEDGRYFEGESFGATGTCVGEICFNTSMTGYQEVLTDPSYRGQIVAMTYPLIGNYGINSIDDESRSPHVRGFVIEELTDVPSNWRSEMSLDEYLRKRNIPGVKGIDTRALTRHLRTRGAMKACLTSEDISPEEATQTAIKGEGVIGMDYVREVSTNKIYRWDPEDKLSVPWSNQKSPDGQGRQALPPIRSRIAAYDYGIKENILRLLRQKGFEVTVVPAGTSAEEVLALDPDGIFLSNGPGDPAALDYAHKTVHDLIGKKPIFGICLGHQVLGFAFGGSTFKLKFGHRGANQPVKDLHTGKVAITAQNHGFAVDSESLPSEVEVTHINLNDGTVEGMRHKELPIFSVQYHPEAAPGPHDATYFFDQFAELIEKQK